MPCTMLKRLGQRYQKHRPKNTDRESPVGQSNLTGAGTVRGDGRACGRLSGQGMGGPVSMLVWGGGVGLRCGH